MEHTRSSSVVFALAGVTHLIVNALVWRDLASRGPGTVRGGKVLWRVLIGLNSGNGLLYLLFGRRRGPTVA